MNVSIPGLPIAATLLVVLVAPIAQAQNVPPALLDCAAEKDDARRLACYDTEVARLRQTPRTAAAAPVAGANSAAAASTAAAAAPAATPGSGTGAAAAAGTAAAAAGTRSAGEALTEEEKFGLRGDLKEEKMPAKKELEATVTQVSARPNGEVVVTLDNGQVWTELSASSALRVKTGDTVRIEAGTLRSFILVTPNGHSGKVKRIK